MRNSLITQQGELFNKFSVASVSRAEQMRIIIVASDLIFMPILTSLSLKAVRYKKDMKLWIDRFT